MPVDYFQRTCGLSECTCGLLRECLWIIFSAPVDYQSVPVDYLENACGLFSAYLWIIRVYLWIT